MSFKRFVLIICILIAPTIRCSLLMRPENILAVVGERVTFKCGTNLTKAVAWLYSQPDSYASTSLYRQGPTNVFTPHRSGEFMIDTTLGNGRYDIVLKAVTMHQAGKYICIDDQGFSDESAAAELIVLDNWSPNCTFKSADCNRRAGASLAVSIICRSQYAGYGNFQMLWSNGTAEPDGVVIESDVERYREVNSHGFVNVTWQTSLHVTTRPLAANRTRRLTAIISHTPFKQLSYKYNFTLPVPALLDVNVNATDGGNYVIGDVITCLAVDQLTDVTVEWVEQGKENRRTNSSVLVLDSEGERNFTCIARMGPYCASVTVHAIISRRVESISLTPVTVFLMIVALVSFNLLFLLLVTLFCKLKSKRLSAKFKNSASLMDYPEMGYDGPHLHLPEQKVNSLRNSDEENVYEVPHDYIFLDSETYEGLSSKKFASKTQMEDIVSNIIVDANVSNYEKLLVPGST